MTTNAQFEKGTMPNENVDQKPSHRFYRRLSRKTRLTILGITLPVACAMAVLALNHLMPKLPNRAQSATDRLAWYVNRGQLKADLHTLASAVEYIVTSDSEFPGAARPAGQPVAGTVTPTPPKS